ncbi:MBL fold metallo-hydrolase [Limnobacter litoralis]|uniref:MBL fold metallo-hydrolase n=1 Tax=Limnobacter litoralis TaxID=481366 RepID=A0ABQ5YQU0_9BURK|nr:MBL fold metallo-hydrolase [Limnobacter litoralis]GLR26988.1 MBL fold metallo-hydrolase [Limnobacter litoralis]
MKRTVTALAISMAVLAGGLAAANTASAAAPMVKTQAPGYYRVMLGDFEITALSDGTVKLPVTKLLQEDAKKTDKVLKKHFLDDDVDTSVNAYLVNTGSKLVLIDTGAAGLFGPTLGNVLANLEAAGYKPEQVDDVVITHMHPDHVGGLMHDGKIAFPNATLHIDKKDTDYWLSKENMEKAPKDKQGFFQGAMASVNPYADTGKLKPFDGVTEIVPGIKAIPTAGHTPGHTEYEVDSKGQKFMVWGDLIHVAAVQFANPVVTIGFDSDPKTARKAREKEFANAAKQGYLVAGSHLSFPGIGHLVKNGKGYTFLPINYHGLK